jgi:hypothetical protein
VRERREARSSGRSGASDRFGSGVQELLEGPSVQSRLIVRSGAEAEGRGEGSLRSSAAGAGRDEGMLGRSGAEAEGGGEGAQRSSAAGAGRGKGMLGRSGAEGEWRGEGGRGQPRRPREAVKGAAAGATQEPKDGTRD